MMNSNVIIRVYGSDRDGQTRLNFFKPVNEFVE